MIMIIIFPIYYLKIICIKHIIIYKHNKEDIIPWEVKYDSNLRIIETNYTGNMNKDELAKAIDETISSAIVNSTYKLLADCLYLTGGHNLFDLYELADISKIKDFVKYVKEAVIIPENQGTIEKVKFWETACLNRGMNVKIFNTRKEALEWLNSE